MRIVDESTCGTVTASPDELVVLVVELIPSDPVVLRVVSTTAVSIVGGHGTRSGCRATDRYRCCNVIIGRDKLGTFFC